MSCSMALIDRIGYDAGFTRLEDALANAASHGFHCLNFNADIGSNRLGLWANDRVCSIRQSCSGNDVHVTLHSASRVNISEFSPHVSEAVDQYLTANMELAHALACDGWWCAAASTSVVNSTLGCPHQGSDCSAQSRMPRDWA